ncbi:MAG TPA: hypothetical protein VGC79_07660, partial [Polyangiaceae bacterium]
PAPADCPVFPAPPALLAFAPALAPALLAAAPPAPPTGALPPPIGKAPAAPLNGLPPAAFALLAVGWSDPQPMNALENVSTSSTRQARRKDRELIAQIRASTGQNFLQAARRGRARARARANSPKAQRGAAAHHPMSELEE